MKAALRPPSRLRRGVARYVVAGELAAFRARVHEGEHQFLYFALILAQGFVYACETREVLGPRIGWRKPFEFGRARETLDERLGHREAQQSLGILDGEGIGDASTDVVADDMGAVDLEMVHQLLDVGRECLLLVARRGAL